MSDRVILPKKYSELRNIYKYHIDSYITLYKLKTKKEEELNSIYKMIKRYLIESIKYHPQDIIRDILNIIPYNNRYAKSYLALAKLIYDDFHINEVKNIPIISNYLFYDEYGIDLGGCIDFTVMKLEDLDIHAENTIYRAIMDNDEERLESFTEIEGFEENQRLLSKLYPRSFDGFSLLELCCYHGAVDCFKFLRTKYNSEITETCLQLSFLGGNTEIISECLKHQKPNKYCMIYSIISHNIDFVTLLMNDYNMEIDLYNCGTHNNLESFLVYFDQTNNFNKCLIYSPMFGIPSLCEYFLSLGANVNEKNKDGQTALIIAAFNKSQETVELLLSHGANIDEKDEYGKTALHYAAFNNSKEIVKLLLSHNANINEKDEKGETALHIAAFNKNKEIVGILISQGANVNEKDKYGRSALHKAVESNSKEMVEFLLLNGANINEKK